MRQSIDRSIDRFLMSHEVSAESDLVWGLAPVFAFFLSNSKLCVFYVELCFFI